MLANLHRNWLKISKNIGDDVSQYMIPGKEFCRRVFLRDVSSNELSIRKKFVKVWKNRSISSQIENIKGNTFQVFQQVEGRE